LGSGHGTPTPTPTLTLFSCSLAGVVFFTRKRPSRLKGRQRPDCSSARTPPLLGERAWGELGESIAEGLLFPGEPLDTDTEETRPPSLPSGLQLEASWGGRLAWWRGRRRCNEEAEQQKAS
jgi:hypothetical protein